MLVSPSNIMLAFCIFIYFRTGITSLRMSLPGFGGYIN